MHKKKIETTEEKLLYRQPMTVKEIIVYKTNDAFPVCPRCTYAIEREYQAFCESCGQMLCWKGFAKAKVRKC